MINAFSNEVKEKLKHYVYRLVDPRNGQTFYVGEGCGDRVFNHVNAKDMTFYEDKTITTEQDKITDENNDPAKIKRIMDIKRSGLEVIHIIQRWGMKKETAFEVEAAFIDFLGLNNLTNIVKGHHSDNGMRWTDELERELRAEKFVDYPDDPNCPKFMVIKIKEYWINKNDGDIYKTVRGYWEIKPSRANNYPYVLAVKHGIVVGVFQINKDGWKRCEDNDKLSYFDGIEAPEEIQNRFFGKKIPDRFRKRQKPATYCC